jgi:hypothetical protein
VNRGIWNVQDKKIKGIWVKGDVRDDGVSDQNNEDGENNPQISQQYRYYEKIIGGSSKNESLFLTHWGDLQLTQHWMISDHAGLRTHSAALKLPHPVSQKPCKGCKQLTPGSICSS